MNHCYFKNNNNVYGNQTVNVTIFDFCCSAKPAVTPLLFCMADCHWLWWPQKRNQPRKFCQRQTHSQWIWRDYPRKIAANRRRSGHRFPTTRRSPTFFELQHCSVASPRPMAHTVGTGACSGGPTGTCDTWMHPIFGRIISLVVIFSKALNRYSHPLNTDQTPRYCSQKWLPSQLIQDQPKSLRLNSQRWQPINHSQAFDAEM